MNNTKAIVNTGPAQREFVGSRRGLINSNLLLFILRETEIEKEKTSRGGAERERERIPRRFCAVSTEPYARLDLMT